MPITHHSIAMLKHRCVVAVLTMASSVGGWETVHAQVLPSYSGHQPLSQRSSPGLAARFAEAAGKTGYLQPIRVVLDEPEARVSIYHSISLTTDLDAAAQTAVMVGHCYRLKISQIPSMPATEIYPTIEVIDRLHPPAGQKHNFPVPIQISNEDIEAAISGNLVTRVVYLEQPQLAAPYALDKATGTTQLLKADNAMTEADRRGRPLVIVRIGGRTPSAHGEHPSFFGTGGTIAESVMTDVPEQAPAAEKEPSDARLPAPRSVSIKSPLTARKSEVTR